MATELQHEETHFEHSDLNARWTLYTGIGVIVGAWVILGIVYLLFAHYTHDRAALSPKPLPIELHGNPLPPEPRLQESPRADMKAMQAREDWELNHYYWIDKQSGKVAIPIDRAMQIVAQQGIPPQKTPANLKLSVPQAGTRETGFQNKVEPEPR